MLVIRYDSVSKSTDFSRFLLTGLGHTFHANGSIIILIHHGFLKMSKLLVHDFFSLARHTYVQWCSFDIFWLIKTRFMIRFSKYLT